MKKLIALITTANLSIGSILSVTSCSLFGMNDYNFDGQKHDQNQNQSQSQNQKNTLILDNEEFAEIEEEIQETNVSSMFEDGIDASDILKTNSTIAEELDFIVDTANSIGENITISLADAEQDTEETLNKGTNTLKIVLKSSEDKKEGKKLTAKVLNVSEDTFSEEEFSETLDQLFIDDIDGSFLNNLNTYEDALSVINEQLFESEEDISAELTNENETNKNLNIGRNTISVNFSDNNIYNKTIKVNILDVEKADESEFENGKMSIESIGYSVAQLSENAISKISAGVKGLGGMVVGGLKAIKNGIKNVFSKKGKKEITLEVEKDGKKSRWLFP